jgi:hypothetical protein
MRLESSIVPGIGSFRIKLLLTAATGTIALIASRLTGWKFGFLWYMTAILTVVAIGCAWAAHELWKDYGPKRNWRKQQPSS